MRLRQLESFLMVADCGSLTLAATRMLIAQPSLSQQISLLEHEIGCVLFERVPRGMRLTPEGRAFLPYARSAVASADSAIDAARAAAGGRTGEVRLATLTSLAIGVLPDLAKRWHRDYPDVRLRLVEYGSPNRLEDGIRIGEADLAIGPIPSGPMDEVIEVGSEEFVLLLPKDDPLAAEERIDPHQLRDREWVLYSHDHGLNSLVLRACSLWGFSPHEAMRTSQVEAMVRLARAGIGPALVPSNALNPETSFVRPITRLLRRLAVFSVGEMGALETELVVNIQREGLPRVVRQPSDAIFL